MTYQPVRNNIKVAKKKKVKHKPTKSEIIKKTIERSKKKHQEYGTSKLEERFARDFLDKLGVKYQYQFYASDIKRYFDFYLVNERVILEIDGDYFHGYGKLYEEMSPMQKKNYRVDNIKNEWAAKHSIPLIRIWEHDINNNPEKVMKLLKEWITVATEKMIIENNKKKRH